MKKTKPVLSKKNPKDTAALLARKAAAFINTHSVVLIFILAGAAIGTALVRSRSLLNPVRNEAHYTDLVSKNKYGKVDYTLVNKLQHSLTDKDITVSQSLSPNRKNPFSE